MIWIWLSAAALAGDSPPPIPDEYPEWMMWAAVVGIPAITAALGGVAKALLVTAKAFGDLGAKVEAFGASQDGILKTFKMVVDNFPRADHDK